MKKINIKWFNSIEDTIEDYQLSQIKLFGSKAIIRENKWDLIRDEFLFRKMHIKIVLHVMFLTIIEDLDTHKFTNFYCISEINQLGQKLNKKEKSDET